MQAIKMLYCVIPACVCANSLMELPVDNAAGYGDIYGTTIREKIVAMLSMLLGELCSPHLKHAACCSLEQQTQPSMHQWL